MVWRNLRLHVMLPMPSHMVVLSCAPPVLSRWLWPRSLPYHLLIKVHGIVVSYMCYFGRFHSYDIVCKFVNRASRVMRPFVVASVCTRRPSWNRCCDSPPLRVLLIVIRHGAPAACVAHGGGIAHDVPSEFGRFLHVGHKLFSLHLSIMVFFNRWCYCVRAGSAIPT